MGSGIFLRRCRIMFQMHVDAVTPAILPGDIGHRAINFPGLDVSWRDMNDAVFWNRLGRFPFADLDITDIAIHPVDDQTLLKSPLTGDYLLGQSKTPELLQASCPQALTKGIFICCTDNPILADLTQQVTVNAGQAILIDFTPQPVFNFQIGARSEIEADNLCRPFPHAACHVVAGNNQIALLIILAAHENMAVRMAGIEMIDRDPVECRAQIDFHLPHQPPGHGFEIGIFCTILGRDDKAELMPITIGPFKKRLAIRPILIGAVKLAGQTFSCNAVALDIAQMRPCTLHAFPGQPDNP
ncbi:hypothetical protein AMSG_11326 [Thecamonas trahens ATCC 50062]|uniref:Uncharacterized protein n=1 Tax=Thecamonas trahens ATCC 50062 TaxID=461836 RepID=A0A0L0DU73_THETB|nr:hypothetical protein AMSG_11326 [Thecamonas trahens ATCC 50062]KNC55874.1 hypothetical protein AMSG_11326 [Thecamonas trahens ATCC 50062]|eukprot:XP_013752745.1 hypothetical protein AMSG_11326 [Thecamonas trahens ATCC 50062]